MRERKLRLNGVPGSQKESSSLVLEVHSSCEVPAGCGGVVLRWRNPAVAMPVLITVLGPQPKQTILLDGVAPVSARPLITCGEHVLAIIVDAVPSEAGMLMASLTCDAGRQEGTDDAVPTQEKMVLSKADGTWRYQLSAPPDDAWLQPGYDDSAWPALVRQPMAVPAKDDYWRSDLYKKLSILNADSLGPQQPTATIWVRRQFVLTPEAIR